MGRRIELGGLFEDERLRLALLWAFVGGMASGDGGVDWS